MTEQFEHAVRLLHSHNPQISQDGFDQLRPQAVQHLDDLIGEFTLETDHAVRCRLLEPLAMPAMQARCRYWWSRRMALMSRCRPWP